MRYIEFTHPTKHHIEFFLHFEDVAVGISSETNSNYNSVVKELKKNRRKILRLKHPDYKNSVSSDYVTEGRARSVCAQFEGQRSRRTPSAPSGKLHDLLFAIDGHNHYGIGEIRKIIAEY